MTILSKVFGLRYEQGEFTPTYVPVTTNFDTDPTYDQQDGDYVRIGNQVFVTVRIRTDNVDATGAAGQISVSGLPYAAIAAYHAAPVGFAGTFGTDPEYGTVISGESRIRLYKAGGSQLAASDLGTGANNNQLYLSCTYITNP
jgi:hypothetical protein